MKSGERDAFKRGVREYVYAMMGTARNAPATAQGELSKGWNREKLGLILGDDEADEIFQRIDAEKVFSDTRQKVNQGSQTQIRAEAAADLTDLRDVDSGLRPDIISRVRRAASEPLNAGLDAVLYGPRRDARNAELGSALGAQGDARDEIVRSLMDQLTKKGQRTGPETAIEMITRALLEGGRSTATQSLAR